MNQISSPPSHSVVPPRRARPFRRAVFGGLGILLPPLLTIVILVWVWNTLRYYVLEPITSGAAQVLTLSLADVRTSLPDAQPIDGEPGVYLSHGEYFRALDRGTSTEYVPLDVYRDVVRHDGLDAASAGGWPLYRRYVEITYLRPLIVVPIFLCVFVLLMYLLGSLFAAGLGQVWTVLEQGIERLPLVRGVYGSVKQVTDFMLTENQLQFTRVVAIEYPARGIWSLAFVTGEGVPAIEAVTGEPVLAVLVPTSPMPVTGYTVVIPKRDVIDLDLTVDQAVQYIVSCGVVVPEHQLNEGLSPAQA